MKFILSYRFWGQVGVLGFVGWGVEVIFPVLVKGVLQGMLHWTNAGILYCWLIQVGVCVVLLSLSRYTRQLCFDGLPQQAGPRISRILLSLIKAWILWQLCRLLLKAVPVFNFFTVVQCLLFLIQVYVLMSIVAPLSRAPDTRPSTSFYITRVLPPYRLPAPKSITKGYPKWTGTAFWILIWVVLDLMGCG